MKTHLLTIDPGVDGGFAFRGLVPGTTPPQAKRFKSGRDAVAFVNEFAYFDSVVTAIEVVHSSPIMAPSSAFTFGGNFGTWLGILWANDFVPYGIQPAAWQKPWAPRLYEAVAAEPRESRKKDARKGELKAIAQEIYPHLKVTLQTADALLISEYVRMEHNLKGAFPGTPITE